MSPELLTSCKRQLKRTNDFLKRKIEGELRKVELQSATRVKLQRMDAVAEFESLKFNIN